MKIHHRLSEAQRRNIQVTLAEYQRLGNEALQALGRAKMLEQLADTALRCLNEKLAFIVDTESLPRPVRPYELTPDGAALVGEAPDDPAAAKPYSEPVGAAHERDNGNG